MQLPDSALENRENKVALALIGVIIGLILLSLLSSLVGGLASIATNQNPTTPEPVQVAPTNAPRQTNSNGFSNITDSDTPIKGSGTTLTNASHHYSLVVPAGYLAREISPELTIVNRQLKTIEEQSIGQQLGIEISVSAKKVDTWQEFSDNRDLTIIQKEFLVKGDYELFRLIIRDQSLSQIGNQSIIITQVFKPNSNKQEFIEVVTGYNKLLEQLMKVRPEIKNADIPQLLEQHLVAYNQVVSSITFKNK